MVEFCFSNGFNFGYGVIFGNYILEIITDHMMNIVIQNDLQLTAFELKKLDVNNDN